HQHVVLAPDLEHLEPVARAIDRLAVVQAEHIVVPATADHSAAALEKGIVQRVLLVRTAPLDAAKALADAKHQDAVFADPGQRRKFRGIRIAALEALTVPARIGVAL